jgi:uncharacterized protein YciI
VEFFVYHRDRAGAAALRTQLVEQHWSYMDGFERELIARGPTLDPINGTPSGSVHVVDLPDATAARAFAFEEPNYQAGVYRDVMVRRWRNLLGRTMWEFPGGQQGRHRYLVLALAPADGAELSVPADTSDLIAYGPLLTDDGRTRLGLAALVRAPDRQAAREVLGDQQYAEVDVRDWDFGGRS